MEKNKPSEALLHLTKEILLWTYRDETLATITDEHMEVLSAIVLCHFFKLTTRDRALLEDRFGTIGPARVQTTETLNLPGRQYRLLAGDALDHLIDMTRLDIYITLKIKSLKEEVKE